MSISVEQFMAIYNEMKHSNSYKFATFKVSGNEVVPDQQGGHDWSFNQFVNALPTTNCRYALYVSNNQLVFIHWAPEDAASRDRMTYVSAKEYVKRCLGGSHTEIVASSAGELQEHGLA